MSAADPYRPHAPFGPRKSSRTSGPHPSGRLGHLAGKSGQGLAPEDVSTPGLGQGEGPVGYKFFSKEEDASSLAGFRLRKGRRRRWEGPEWRAPKATGTEFLRSQVPARSRRKRGPPSSNWVGFEDEWRKNGLPGSLEAYFVPGAPFFASRAHRRPILCPAIRFSRRQGQKHPNLPPAT